jgi:hypothetical protein
LLQGRPGPVPTVAEAEAYDWSPAEWNFVQERWADQALGSPETVANKLSELLSTTAASELMITIPASGPSERISSLERTRELFGPAELPQGLAATGTLAFPRPQEDETVRA